MCIFDKFVFIFLTFVQLELHLNKLELSFPEDIMCKVCKINPSIILGVNILNSKVIKLKTNDDIQHSVILAFGSGELKSITTKKQLFFTVYY